MKRTYLRHCMLHACWVGRVRLCPSGTGREFDIQSTVSPYVQMARALNWLLDNGLASGCGGWIQPNASGLDVLSKWDAKYGAVSGGV